MAETELVSPFGTFELHRGVPRSQAQSSPLRAWSAADLLLLNDIAAADVTAGVVDQDPSAQTGWLVVNDAWGAISIPLARHLGPDRVQVWGDSATAAAAIAHNARSNSQAPIRYLPGDLLPASPKTQRAFGAVALIVPKSLALFEWFCSGIAASVPAGTPVTIAAMNNHLSKGVFGVLESHLDDVAARRAVGKARIIDAVVGRNHGGDRPTAVIPQPAFELAIRNSQGDQVPIQVHEAPGVFSAGHLDSGTAVLLAAFGAQGNQACPGLVQRLSGAASLADLGCGSGVIGTALAMQSDCTDIAFIDSSHLAIAAARATASSAAVESPRSRFVVADGMASGEFDLIVSNPPFHQGHAVDRALTTRLLDHARRCLTPGGSLVVVVQRHHQLHKFLQHRFGSVQARSRHSAFVVLEARGP